MNDVSTEEKTVWSTNMKCDFVKNICVESIIDIEKHIEMLNDIDNLTQENVDDVVNMISLVFDGSARKCKMKKKCYGNIRLYTRNNENKPWFSKDCEVKRKEYFNAKNKFRNNNSIYALNKMKKASKNYKKQLKLSYQKYYKDINIEIKKLSKHDPKRFWKIINNKKDSRNKIMPDLETFKNHFEELNKGNEISKDDETKI